MTISVVIPTLDEADHVTAAIESAIAPGVEIIVVDGGSRDETCRRAREAGALVLALSAPSEPRDAEVEAKVEAEVEAKVEAKAKAEVDAEPSEAGGEPARGRAHQLRLGAERSKGEVLLFLHADTRLAPGWRRAVEQAMADPACAGGAFALRFVERGWRERWIEGWAALRVAWLGLPYGDQALFVRRSVLERMGGVPKVPIMEDLDLVRGIKRAGRLARLPLAATTSARRYHRAGTWRTVLWHQVALLGWVLGWDRSRLARRMGR